MKKILSIDFSTGSKHDEGCGYAFRDETGKIISGSIKPYSKGSTMHSRTDIIIEELEKIIFNYYLEDYDICIEKPILAGNSGKSIELAQMNGYTLGRLHALTQGGVYNIPNSKWCAYHLIKGRRKERKASSVELFKQMTDKTVPDNYKDDNEADAFNQLLYCEVVDYAEFY